MVKKFVKNRDIVRGGRMILAEFQKWDLLCDSETRCCFAEGKATKATKDAMKEQEDI